MSVSVNNIDVFQKLERQGGFVNRLWGVKDGKRVHNSSEVNARSSTTGMLEYTDYIPAK